MTDISWSMGRIVEAIERTEQRIGEFLDKALPVDRQAFLDRAAVVFSASRQMGEADSWDRAEALLAEREKRRGQISPEVQRGAIAERALVVGYLERMYRGQRPNIGISSDSLELLIDAIKAGKHRLTEEDAPDLGQAPSTTGASTGLAAEGLEIDPERAPFMSDRSKKDWFPSDG